MGLLWESCTLPPSSKADGVPRRPVAETQVNKSSCQLIQPPSWLLKFNTHLTNTLTSILCKTALFYWKLNIHLRKGCHSKSITGQSNVFEHVPSKIRISTQTTDA